MDTPQKNVFFYNQSNISSKKFLQLKIIPIFAPAKGNKPSGTGPVAQLDRATDF